MKKLLFAMVLSLLAVPAHAEGWLDTAIAVIDADVKKTVIADLQDISVMINVGRAQGSGTLFTRKVETPNGDETVTYVWTAAHVVEDQKETRQVIVNGNTKTIIEYPDVVIIQEIKQDGRRIGELKRDARVVRSSDSDSGEDLALLEIRERNFAPVTRSARFHLGDEIPGVGTELYHVGSLLTKYGANSLTDGIISQVGRVLPLRPEGTVFDQTSVVAHPGSSGGGVFLKSNGEYAGMLVRAAGPGFNFIVPVRRMREWAERAKVLWAIDPNVPMPGESKKLPVEDAGDIDFLLNPFFGITPQSEKRAEINAEFPFLLGGQPTLAPCR